MHLFFYDRNRGSGMKRNRWSGSVSESLEDYSALKKDPDQESLEDYSALEKDPDQESLEDYSALEKDPDQAMAPLEDSDSDMEQMDDHVQRPAEESDENNRNSEQDISEETHTQIPPTHVSPEAEPQRSAKEREETLSVRQLKTVLFALCSGIDKASESLATEPELIKTWLGEKETQLESECQRTTVDGGDAMGAIERLVEWVLAQQEQQLPVSYEDLFHKASELRSQANQNSSFRISHEWAVSFMLQHRLGAQTIANVDRPLPGSMEGDSLRFTDFVQKQIKLNDLRHSVIGAMDELSIFVDVDCLLDTAPLVKKKMAFQFVGSGRSLIDIYLAILADGTVLPTLVFFKGQLPSGLLRGLPNCVLVEGKAEGFTEEEELDIWIEKVWRKHLSAHNDSKALLVMDGYRRHKSDPSLGNLSNCNTLPAIIQTGCSSRHQPLEMCFRPVLQTFLLKRWAQLAEKGGSSGASARDVVQLLVAWLVEALSSLSDPGIIQRSFCLAKVVDEEEGNKNPADAQAELIATMKEAMLRPKEMEPKSPGETAMRTSDGEQVRNQGQETHPEDLPEAEAETLSNAKEQTAAAQADETEETHSESADRAE